MNAPIHVLIVDDESSIRNLLRVTLESHGYTILQSENGADAIAQAKTTTPNLIILDLGLPDIDGLEVLKQVRQTSSVPILILTVVDDADRKVELLDCGADDYLTKPFSMPELLARVRLAIRHHQTRELSVLFSSGDLTVDLGSRSVHANGKRVRLTTTEFELLAILIKDSGRVVPQNHILSSIWGVNALEQTHYLRIYIAQLRKKLELQPSSPRHILTEPGVGYRII